MDVHQQQEADRGAVNSPAFQELVRSRARFAVPAVIAGFGAYVLIVALSGFTGILNARVVGPVTWTWLLTVGVFPVVWLLGSLYIRRTARWDELAEQVSVSRGEGDRS